jgi:hypothetical protein
MPTPVGPGGSPTIPTTPSSNNTGSASGTGGAANVNAPPSVSGTPGVGTDSVSSTGGSASGGGLVNKVRDKLVERTWKEITTEHSARIASLDLGDSGALGMRLSERVYLSDGRFVTDDPVRKATTERLAATTGENIFWLETGGLMDAKVGLSKSVPLGGVLNVHGGFSTGGLLEYRALHPYAADVGAVASGVPRDHTVRLPIDADKARALEPGTQVEIVGKGSATLSAGIGAGTSTSVGSVTGSVGASIGASSTVAGTWSVHVTRLEDDKVRVVLGEVKERTRATSVGVSAGLTIDGAEVIDDTVGGTIDSAAESVDIDEALGNIPGLDGDGGLAGLIKREGASAVEKAVRRYTAFHASRGRSANETRRELTSYVFDLSKPAARQSYDELLRLSERNASLASDQAGSGVSRHVYTEDTTSVSSDTNISFAGKKLLLVNTLRKERDGQLTTGSGTQLIRTDMYKRSYNGFITGRRDIKWEGVRVEDAATGASNNYFHLKFSKDDKITHNHEIRSFVRFADFLGVQDADDRVIDMPSSNWLGRLFGSDDNTRVDTDVYFTDDGVRAIADSDKAAVVTAFVLASEALEPDLAGIPHDNPQARSLIDQFNTLEAEIEELERFSSGDDRDEVRDLEYAQWRLGRDYKDAFGGRKLKEDAPVVRGAEKLAAHVGEMTGAADEAAWIKVFGDIGEANKFDFMRSIGALAKLAGPEATLLHEVSLQGSGIHLRAVDEGKLEHPDATVNNAIHGNDS